MRVSSGTSLFKRHELSHDTILVGVPGTSRSAGRGAYLALRKLSMSLTACAGRCSKLPRAKRHSMRPLARQRDHGVVLRRNCIPVVLDALIRLRWVQAGTRGEGRRELAWPQRDDQNESHGRCTRLLRSAISNREYLDRGSLGAGRDCNEVPIQPRCA
jgi:hypothetical protein